MFIDTRRNGARSMEFWVGMDVDEILTTMIYAVKGHHSDKPAIYYTSLTMK